jgi:hypothetical protein
MNALSAFFIDSLIFLVAFRGLSSPRSKLPGVARIALGIVAVFGAAIITLWAECSAWALLIVGASAAIGSIGMHGDGLTRLTDALGGYRLAVYLLSVVGLAALVFLVVPITTFLTSPGEISIHLDYLLTVNARDAMVVVYVAAVLYALAVTSRMKTAITLLALGALALGIAYAFALPFGYPMMTGLTFEQLPISGSARALRVLVDAAVVVAVGFALRFVLLRFGARPIVVAIVMINVSLGIAAVAGVQRDQVGGAGGSEVATAAADKPLRFSQTHPNVLMIFLDRFMGSYVESILQSDPQLADRLSGFTWYPRTVSAGENSIAGVHPMLGGYDYTPVEMNARGKPLRDVSAEAFAILPYNFSKKGYRVNVVGPRGLGFTMAGECSYLAMDGVSCTHIPPTLARQKAQAMGFPLHDLATSNYADLLVLLGSMRGAPYALKEVLRVNGPWRPFMDHSAGTTFKVWAELQAFGELTSTGASESNFNFVSNILPHEPYFMGENCQPLPGQFMVPPEEVKRRGHASLFSLQHAIAARCALLSVANYLDYLKSAGVYDNTKIAIVSDHGIVGDVQDTSARAAAGGTQDNIFVRLRPLVLIKEIGASGPVRISEQFMPNAEVPRILCAQIGGCVNPYLNGKPIEAGGRDDPFYVSLVPWQFSLQKPDSFVITDQFALEGKDPFNAKGWVVLKSSRVR